MSELVLFLVGLLGYSPAGGGPNVVDHFDDGDYV